MTRRRARVMLMSAGLTLLLFGSANALAGTLTLSWTPPTEREDGTPLPPSEIAGYKIYYGTSATSYSGTGATQGPSPIDVPIGSLANAVTPSYSVTGLTTCQTYFIVMTTYDTNGAESRFSYEVNKPALDAPVVAPPQSAGPGALQLGWSGPPSGDPGTVQGYTVYYDTDSGQPYQGVGAAQGTSPIVVAGTSRSMQLTGLVPDATYYVAVEATCGGGANGSTKLSAEVYGVTGATIPQPDSGTPPPPPPRDAGVPTYPRDAGAVMNPPDQGQPPIDDDSGAPIVRYDTGSPQQPTPWPDGGVTGQYGNASLSGGCNVGDTSASALSLALLFALLLVRRRRE